MTPLRLHAVAGLPRSGSTLLCNLLNQHPEVYASSTSALCPSLANEVHFSSSLAEVKSDLAHDREGTEARAIRVLRGKCEAWYEGQEKRVVADKSRGWNFNALLLEHLYPEAKILVVVRDLRHVLASIERQHRATVAFDESRSVEEKTVAGRMARAIDPSGVVGRPLIGIQDLVQRKAKNCFFLRYEDLTTNPAEYLRSVTTLLKVSPFEFDTKNVVNVATDLDALYLNKFPHEGSGEVRESTSGWDDVLPADIAHNVKSHFQWFYSRFGYMS